MGEYALDSSVDNNREGRGRTLDRGKASLIPKEINPTLVESHSTGVPVFYILTVNAAPFSRTKLWARNKAAP